NEAARAPLCSWGLRPRSLTLAPHRRPAPWRSLGRARSTPVGRERGCTRSAVFLGAAPPLADVRAPSPPSRSLIVGFALAFGAWPRTVVESGGEEDRRALRCARRCCADRCDGRIRGHSSRRRSQHNTVLRERGRSG